MKPNPYSAPLALEREIESSEMTRQGCSSEVSWLLLPPVICTVAGFAWYVLAATIVEYAVMPNVEPYKYPYGGPAIFLCLPLSTFYGLLIGFATSVLGSKQWKYTGQAWLVATVVSTLITIYWWSQFENAAECSSKYVLFYPLFALNILTGVIGSFLVAKLATKRHGGY